MLIYVSEKTIPAGGYPSADDLPTVVALREQLRALKLLGLVMPEQRRNAADIERRLSEITTTVDRFYQVLGDRNWIFHDDLNFPQVTAMLNSGEPVDDIERRFIEEQYGPDWLSFTIGRLRSLPAMRPRMNLITKAEVDYREGRYYAVVLVLIAVMDGFVNDLDPGNRKGLHARDESEMQAWDSVVGHHAGLARAHRAFTKPIKSTVTEPVYELHRHGLMHGTVLDFDNILVAAKAWNRLFAVADWARAATKQREPPEPKPKLREVFKELGEAGRVNKRLAAWRPWSLHPGDDSYEGDPAVHAATVFFDAWQRKQWNLMSPALPFLVQRQYGNSVGRVIKDMYSDYELRAYSIERIDFAAAAMCECTTKLTFESDTVMSTSRWCYEPEDGERRVVIPPDPGVWRLARWGVDWFVSPYDVSGA
jgi:hypothetical protein